MNLTTAPEFFIAVTAISLALGAVGGLLANWWSRRDDVKQMERWEAELVDRELKAHEAVLQAMDKVTAEREAARAIYRIALRLIKSANAELDDEDSDTVAIPTVVTDGEVAD